MFSNTILLFFFITTFSICNISAGNVVCYFASWTIYRQNNGQYSALDTDPNLCTHINYGFIALNEDGSVRNMDNWESDPDGKDEIGHLRQLKNQNPNLKLLVSLGGWNEGSEKYSRVAADPNRRQNLIQSVIQFIDKYSFDGFDLDWEYPNQRGGSPQDIQNFVQLLREIKGALAPRGKLLTVAVAGGISSEDLSYDFRGVSDAADMINVMAYDFHGAFEPFVGHLAPLYPSHLDQTEDQRQLNVAQGLQHWIDKGADPRKLNLGLGTYGRGFTLADPNNGQLYAPTYGPCNAGPYTQAPGTVGYNEICEYYSNWQYSWDDEQVVPHIQNGNQWIGFEDQRSLIEKARFAKSKNLGGIMIWSLDTDDFRGLCGKGKFPLINAAKNAFNN